MKTDLKAKYIQHLINKKKSDEGFTLIELLVVIIIIGILSAIALPSFLNQANRARESEAKQYAGTMNRGQQSFYLEATEFSDTITGLGLGIASKTENYSYIIRGGGADTTAVTNTAQPIKQAASPVRAYLGATSVGTVAGTGEATTFATLCEGIQAPIALPAAQGADDGVFAAAAAPDCPANYKKIS